MRIRLTVSNFWKLYHGNHTCNFTGGIVAYHTIGRKADYFKINGFGNTGSY
jgi:hypothetical protein